VVPADSSPPVGESVRSSVTPNAAAGDDAVPAKEDGLYKAATIELNPKLAEEHYGRGIAYAQNGRYDEAIAELTEAIRLSPKWAQAYYNRGVIYGHKGNHGLAIADLNDAIRLHPKLAIAYYGRGCAYWHYGQHAQAEKDFAEAKRLGYSWAGPKSTNVIETSLSALAGAIPLLRP
jgi:tetratricopeptide (TPR) repeat protein